MTVAEAENKILAQAEVLGHSLSAFHRGRAKCLQCEMTFDLHKEGALFWCVARHVNIGTSLPKPMRWALPPICELIQTGEEGVFTFPIFHGN